MLDRADKNIIWEQDHLWLLHLLCKVTLSPFSLIFSQLEILSQLVFPAVPPRCSCLGLQRSCQAAESKLSKGLGRHLALDSYQLYFYQIAFSNYYSPTSVPSPTPSPSMPTKGRRITTMATMDITKTLFVLRQTSLPETRGKGVMVTLL